MMNIRTWRPSVPPAWLDARLVIHVGLVSILVWLSYVLQRPEDTFASPTFAGFAEIGTEQQWAYWLMAAAACGFIGLTTTTPWVQLVSVLILASIHGEIAWCFYNAHLPSGGLTTGSGTYAIVAAQGYYLCLRRFFGI